MNPSLVGATTTLLLSGAVMATGRATNVVPRSLGSARARLHGTAGHPAPDRGGFVERQLGSGARLAGLSAERVRSRAVASAAVVGVATAMVLSFTAAVASAPPLPVSLVLLGLASASAAWTVVTTARTTARRAHAEMRRATSDLIQLVAIGLTTDQSVEEAIRFALDTMARTPSVATEVLHERISSAPRRAEPVWVAIGELGNEFGLGELADFGHSLERQALHGVAIGATVSALADGMRARALDQLERDADRANANLAGPTAGFVVATLVFLAYPLAQRISEAFGG